MILCLLLSCISVYFMLMAGTMICWLASFVGCLFYYYFESSDHYYFVCDDEVVMLIIFNVIRRNGGLLLFTAFKLKCVLICFEFHFVMLYFESGYSCLYM